MVLDSFLLIVTTTNFELFLLAGQSDGFANGFYLFFMIVQVFFGPAQIQGSIFGERGILRDYVTVQT